MIGFLGELEVEQPPSEAFDLLADMALLDRWNPNVTGSKRVAGDQWAPGSRYESTIARGPIRMTAKSELVRVEPGRSVSYEGSIGQFWSVDTLTFEAAGSGTRITFRNESKGPVWLRPLEPLLNAMFQRQAHRAIEGARRYLGTSR